MAGGNQEVRQRIDIHRGKNRRSASADSSDHRVGIFGDAMSTSKLLSLAT